MRRRTKPFLIVYINMPESTSSRITRWTFSSFTVSSIVSLPQDSVEDLTPQPPYCGALPFECHPIVPGPMARHAAWPPVVLNTENLGLLVDGNGRRYPRDVGRSSRIGKDGIVFQFGDTYVQDEMNECPGKTSCTLALVHYPRSLPTVTTYRLGGGGTVSSFIPPRPEEYDGDIYGRQTTLQSFGGLIETDGEDGGEHAGWIFYRKGTELYPDGGNHKTHYTGAVKLVFDHQKKNISIWRPCTPLQLFRNDEPSFGTFSTVRQGKTAYLFGHAPHSARVMLARVDVSWILDRSRYQYWDGKKYQDEIVKAKHVLEDVEHGAVYRSQLFEPKKGRDWIFVGCSQSGNSRVLLGVSANLEGPYTKLELMDTFSINPTLSDSSRYCIYPHPWAFKEEDGELMITWSEGTREGGVVAVKVQFAMTMDKGQPSLIMERDIKKGKGKCVIL